MFSTQVRLSRQIQSCFYMLPIPQSKNAVCALIKHIVLSFASENSINAVPYYRPIYIHVQSCGMDVDRPQIWCLMEVSTSYVLYLQIIYCVFSLWGSMEETEYFNIRDQNPVIPSVTHNTFTHSQTDLWWSTKTARAYPPHKYTHIIMVFF